MEFEILKDLVKSVSKHTSKKIEVVTNLENNKSKIGQFYNGLIQGKFKDEKEAVRLICKSYDVKNATYLKIKDKLIKQLNNSALFVDTNHSSYNERAKAYYNAYKDFAIAVSLLSRDTIKPAIYTLQKVLDQAIKYELIDLAADTLKMLRGNHALTYFDSEKHSYYINLYKTYEKKRKWENLASEYYDTLLGYYLNNRSPNDVVNRISSEYYEELLDVAETVNTSGFYRNLYIIGIIKYASINDSKNALKVCEEALAVLSTRPNTNRGTISLFLLQKVSLLTQLKTNNISEVNNIFQWIYENSVVSELSSMRIKEISFYFFASHNLYRKSLDSYKDAVNSDGFLSFEGSIHDNWLLLGGYLHLLARLNQLDPQEVESVVGKFRYSKLFNEIEVLKKDKEGMNIPLILLPVLYELAQEPGKSMKEIPTDGLEKYRQRWLANDLNRRSNSFFRIVITLAQHQVLTAQQKKKINRELAIIRSETPEIARQHFAIEVIPYETLTELLLEKMGLFSILEQPEPLATN
ncbi:MAG: hypothetical protein JNM22_12585 [Saprospiraceae bacterium]|nr:hypothetical protein [Saprospiraceae bacterium]